MPNEESSDLTTRLTTAQTVDTGRAASSPFKLPASLRADLDADLAALKTTDADTAPAEGGRAGAVAARRAAITELVRQHRGGYRGIAAIDETTITEPQRIVVFEAYGWASGEIGRLDEDTRIIALARQAPTVSAADVGGNATYLYSAARLSRIAAQLAIIDASESVASGADSELATLRRDTALDLAATTLLRIRFLYCSATRDADATPELTRIGYQPRRDPGEVAHPPTGGTGGSSSSSGPPSSSSSGSSSSSSSGAPGSSSSSP